MIRFMATCCGFTGCTILRSLFDDSGVVELREFMDSFAVEQINVSCLARPFSAAKKYELHRVLQETDYGPLFSDAKDPENRAH